MSRRQVRSHQPTSRAALPPNIPSSTATSRAAPPAPGAQPRRASGPAVSEDVQFALEALHNLVTYCSDWAKRLDELSGQIDQRQVDLAQFAEQHSSCKKKRLKSCGSTESLKPKDYGEAHPGANRRTSAEETLAAHNNAAQRISGLTNATTQREQSGAEEAHSPSSSAVERQTPQVQAAAMAKARAALRRSQLGQKRGATDSLVSGDGQAVVSKYRSKTLVVVYYDSFVQSFFEEVVKFVSASRSLMRKAKMAAKVAHIKRMAALELPDDDSPEESDAGFGNGTTKFLPPQLSPSAMQIDGVNGTDGDDMETEKTQIDQAAINTKPEMCSTNGLSTMAPPTPKRASPPSPNINGTSNLRPLSPDNVRSSLVAWSPYNCAKQPAGILDDLDKGLEYVQSMCEQAAHQFLRDGDCSDEIVKIQDRLTTTRTSAENELKSMLENDADGSMEKSMIEGGSTRNCTYRPHILRRDMVGGGPSQESPKTSPVNGHRGDDFPRANSNVDGLGFGRSAGLALEVDDGLLGGEAADGIQQEPSKFEFRSTRTMGRRVANGL